MKQHTTQHYEAEAERAESVGLSWGWEQKKNYWLTLYISFRSFRKLLRITQEDQQRLLAKVVYY